VHLALGAGCAALALLLAGSVFATPTASASPQLIELRPSSTCDAASILRGAGAATVAASLRLYRLESNAAAQVLPRLRACGALRFTTPDTVAGTMTVTDFTDPLVDTEWWREAIGVAGLTPPGPGKPITIVDSGVDVAHPEFAGRSSIVTLNEQEPAPLGGVHGTAVASLIGAPADDVGMVGIYPQALLQTWDAARGAGTVLQTSDIVAGVLAAANQGPGVINLSLGAERSALPIQQAIETAIRKGMLVVAAAGNDGDIGSPLSFPASLPHVLTAAATDRQNQVTSFSSRSRFVDLAAPGDDITVATALDDSWAPEAGTSFSSPLVAGAASWVWTVRPELDASQLFEVMRRSAVDIDAPGRDDATGFGLLNVPAALAYAAPVPDPLEPNDDMDYVTPGKTFYNGIAPITTKAKPSTTLTARLTAVEDPRDVYRVFAPAHGAVTVKVPAAAGVALGLWTPATQTVLEATPTKHRVASGSRSNGTVTVAFKNTGAARTLYLAVTLAARVSDATYKIAVSAR
jgi:subtilisin family serine protease